MDKSLKHYVEQEQTEYKREHIVSFYLYEIQELANLIYDRKQIRGSLRLIVREMDCKKTQGNFVGRKMFYILMLVITQL